MAELRVELSLKGVGFPIIYIVSCQSDSPSPPPLLDKPERSDRPMAFWLHTRRNDAVVQGSDSPSICAGLFLRPGGNNLGHEKA